MKFAKVRSNTVNLCLETEAIDFEAQATVAQFHSSKQSRTRSSSMSESHFHSPSSTSHTYNAPKTARRLRADAFTKLDQQVQSMCEAKLLPYVQSIEKHYAWQSKIPSNVSETDRTSCALYLKFFQNRTRFEVLARLVGSGAYVSALQAIAMECAMDTLLLLEKAWVLAAQVEFESNETD